MRLNEKAKESLEAAERLLNTADGEIEALMNAAASRAYYAAYQAVVDRAIQARRPMEPGAIYYRHDVLPDRAFQWQILSEDLRDDLDWLQGLRVKADYFQDQVGYDEASEATVTAEKIVNHLLKDEEP